MTSKLTLEIDRDITSHKTTYLNSKNVMNKNLLE